MVLTANQIANPATTAIAMGAPTITKPVVATVPATIPVISGGGGGGGGSGGGLIIQFGSDSQSSGSFGLGQLGSDLQSCNESGSIRQADGSSPDHSIIGWQEC